jgi:hypothetical protein
MFYGAVGFSRYVVSCDWPGHRCQDKEDNEMKYAGWSVFITGLILSLASWGVALDCLVWIYRRNQLKYQFLLSACNSSAIMFAVIAVAGLGLVFLSRKARSEQP